MTGSLPLFIDVKGPPQSVDDITFILDKMETIWSSEPAYLGVWTSDLFGIEGRFSIRFPDGRSANARIRRCGPCGGVTLQSRCPLSERPGEAISPLLEGRAA